MRLTTGTLGPPAHGINRLICLDLNVRPNEVVCTQCRRMGLFRLSIDMALKYLLTLLKPI